MLVESKKKTRWNKMKRESERRPRRKEDDYERLDAGFSLRSFFLFTCQLRGAVSSET